MYNINIEYGNSQKISFYSEILIVFVLDNEFKDDQINTIEKATTVTITPKTKEKIIAGCEEIFINNVNNNPETLIIKTIKLDKNFSSDYFRNYFAETINKIYTHKIKTLSIILPEFSYFESYFHDKIDFISSFIEGLHFGNYRFDKYKSNKKNTLDLKVLLQGKPDGNIEKIINDTTLLMNEVSFARDLENEPSNSITPKSFCEVIKERFSSRNISIQEWNEEELISNKMHGLIAVGMGSNNKPKFLKLHYLPETNALKKIVLIGKGITFDSGGISIKPSADMWEMKADMSGAAVVSSVISVCELLKLPLEIICFIPLAENMPSGTALKPGDIITTMSGKTIEVDNTDAEGRLILSDALSIANKESADLIIDIATLTGGIVVALGYFSAGMFTHNDKYAELLYKSGLSTFEKVWRLPLWNEYTDLIKSDFADMKNTGGRWGSAITAAKFLENFVEDASKWVHIDIAGPTFPSDRSSYTKKYMTGFGVRLLVDFLKKLT